MLRRSLLHTNSRAGTFVPLINCVIEDALNETLPDIYQALFQFIVHQCHELARPAAAFLPYFAYFCSQSISDLRCWVLKI